MEVLKRAVLTAELGGLGFPASCLQFPGEEQWHQGGGDRSGDHGREMPLRKSSTSHDLLCQGWGTPSWCFLPSEKDKNLIFEEPLSKAAPAHQAFLLLE